MQFEDKIRALAIYYDLSVTSWIRSRKRNLAVGGVNNSRHLFGFAVDVVLDDLALTEQFVADANRIGLEVIQEGDHLHVQDNRI